VNQYDVAQWMIEQIHERGRVHYAELAREGLARFGGAWVVVGVQGMRFSDPVLAAFRRRHAGLIRWQSPYWESLRTPADKAPIP
jgi:hypothetical protein